MEAIANGNFVTFNVPFMLEPLPFKSKFNLPSFAIRLGITTEKSSPNLSLIASGVAILILPIVPLILLIISRFTAPAPGFCK